MSPAGEERFLDADLFYFDPDTSWDAEDAVIRHGEHLFAGLPVPVEIRHEARVHLRYADRFTAPAPAAFRSAAEPIARFAAVCCCYGIRIDRTGAPASARPTATTALSPWWSGPTAATHPRRSTSPRPRAGSSPGPS